MNQRRFFKPHFGIKLSTHASFLVRGGERRTNYNCQIYGRGREQLAGGETVVKRERESETQNSSGEAGRSFSTLLLPGAGRGSTSCVPERLLQRCLEETLFTTSAVLLYSPPHHHHRGACCHFVGSTNNTLGEAW